MYDIIEMNRLMLAGEAEDLATEWRKQLRTIAQTAVLTECPFDTDWEMRNAEAHDLFADIVKYRAEMVRLYKGAKDPVVRQKAATAVQQIACLYTSARILWLGIKETLHDATTEWSAPGLDELLLEDAAQDMRAHFPHARKTLEN